MQGRSGGGSQDRGDLRTVGQGITPKAPKESTFGNTTTPLLGVLLPLNGNRPCGFPVHQL